jgi:hypothetical protein
MPFKHFGKLGSFKFGALGLGPAGPTLGTALLLCNLSRRFKLKIKKLVQPLSYSYVGIKAINDLHHILGLKGNFFFKQ